MSQQSAWLDRLGIALGPADEAFAADWREWLDAHQDRAAEILAERGPTRRDKLRDWQAAMSADRWVAPEWPEEHGGRAATFPQQLLYHLELAYRRMPSLIGRTGLAICGPTLMRHGTPDQQARFLPSMRSGREVWCQGFSEPEAGSDLAGLRTWAEIDSDELVITGQKIWTTNAHIADWMFALVRTSRTSDKRDGITYVLIPMNSAGLTVRPIKQISGDAEFCEVFFDAVRVPIDNVVGTIGDGWHVGRTTLANERSVLFISRQVVLSRLVERIVSTAQQNSADLDGTMRERIARGWGASQLIRINGSRSLGMAVGGLDPGPEASMGKLYGQETEKILHELALDVSGVAALSGRVTEDPRDPRGWATGWLRTRASTIGGGTSEVQKNILAERVLGQPRDLWADQ